MLNKLQKMKNLAYDLAKDFNNPNIIYNMIIENFYTENDELDEIADNFDSWLYDEFDYIREYALNH